ncbi:uncharacterized protein C8R40DRAFT_1171269 [Lentinula edodes]|uniref:uncharacterized protein n=1 Tax=Lentinula edodes TaxID=5353 RepID=UPI001E8E7CE8|nr:uncharacterized protein C8R40DRAFT_1171269 [Lentinula edodes]KAH7874658.1 hypothetical protein C8R40DRAFT_1171269 [Lentinula edodes]
MPVQSEKRVLWHPRHSNKFVVGGGSQITLYELSDEQPEIRQVTSQHELQFMKCFAWSPASIPSDIFAVGHTSGRVDLLRLEASRYSQLGRDENVLSSGPILSLPVRNQRSCNALAFCPSDPNYLAVGLDKVRGDSSLVIWDVQEEMGVFRTTMNPFDNSNVVTIPHSKELIGKFSTYPPIPRTDHPVRTDQRIVQAHAQTELISSLAWLPQNTHPYLLLAGLSPRWLRLFDIRNPAGSGAGASYVSSIATKVTGIATDPFDTTRFATWGDGVVTVWDLRKLHISRIHSDSTNATPSPTPLLTFSEKDAGLDGVSSTLALGASKPSVASSSTSSKTRGVSATDFPNLPVVQHSTYMTAEFSPSRRGVLVTLAKDANYVRLWDVLEVDNSPISREVDNVDENIIKLQDKVPVGRKSWANLPWGSSGTSTESKNPSPIHEEEHREQSQHPMLILYNTRKAFTRSIPNPLCSFAAVPPVYLSHKTISKIVVVSQLGEITVQSVHDAPQALAWSSRGDMLYGPLQSVDKDDVKIGFGVVHSYHEEQEETVKDEYIHDSQTSPSVTRPSTNQKPFPASEPNELHERGRPRNPITFREVPPSPALFGRGDAEGFPALSRPIIENPVSANLAATKPTDGRKEEEKKMTFSPAAALRVPLRPTNALLSPLNVSAIPYNEPSTPIKSQSSNPPTPKYQSMVNGGKASVVHAAANDISVLMRRRAIRGYSIRDPLRNASVIRELSRSGNPGAGVEFEEPSVFRSKESEMLADLWEWIHHSQKFLSSPTPLVQGYDFSFAGVWGIWDGPPSIGGSGTIPRYKDSNTHYAEHSTNMSEEYSSNSGSLTSGSVSSSLTGSINMSSGSSMMFGGSSIISGNIGDAEATPVHRDRLELPLETETASLYPSFDRSRRVKAQDETSTSRTTRTRSPITEPLTNDPEWRQALLQLLARTEEAPSASRLPNFPYVSTSRPLQRHVCLHLIGWGFILRDDSLMAEVRRWEREGEGDEGYARAAAWLVFSGRYGGGAGVSNEGAVHGEGAIECLLRSEGAHFVFALSLLFSSTNSNPLPLRLDESHHMMSGVIAALVPFASATLTTPNSSSKLALPSTLLEHYARLVNKLQDSYLRALLTHLTAISSSVTPSGEHWLEILHDEEDLLPFYERLALAFCFLDDTALTTYLRRCREHALGKNGGDVDALIVTGLGTSEGREVVGLWLDRIGDVQSAALLGWTGLSSSLGRERIPKLASDLKTKGQTSIQDSQVTRWVETYRDFLDSVKLFHCRVEFDIERGEMLQIAKDQKITNLAPRQILIRCNYCNKTVTPNAEINLSESNNLGTGQDSIPRGKPTTCPNCGRALPRCSICLMILSIVPDAHREAELLLNHSQYRGTSQSQ